MKKIFKLILLFAVFVNPTAKSDEFDVKAKNCDTPGLSFWKNSI